MRDARLTELNFRNLLHYADQPQQRGRYTNPQSCAGFCVSCEENGYLQDSPTPLDQMSHGADTYDFELALGKLPDGGVEFPVMFIFESPGGYYSNGQPVTCQGVTKQPPVNAYYWTPEGSEWPTDPKAVDTRSYGPYLAYLLQTHRLHAAYFTNFVKCSLGSPETKRFFPFKAYADPNIRDSRIRANCFDRYLKAELEIVAPKIVFFFGTKSFRMGQHCGLGTLVPYARLVLLLHPAARGFSSDEIISDNDMRIRAALRPAHTSTNAIRPINSSTPG